jgi:hypothetical protein
MSDGSDKGELERAWWNAQRELWKLTAYRSLVLKKKTQVRLRKHLSKWFALALVILTLFREVPELSAKYFAGRVAALDSVIIRVHHWQVSHALLFDSLVVGIVLATLAALAWERWGNKLTTSPQEVRFVTATYELLLLLEEFIFGTDRLPNLDERLDKFVEKFLQYTTEAISSKTVDGCLMWELEATTWFFSKSQKTRPIMMSYA